ncbi:MAG: hypothetical protein IH830_13560 [Planctomycetes bacterium]|nr:hypothetical protein [Planctomycetota bacterium]
MSLDNLRFALRSFSGRYPWLFYPTYGLIRLNRRRRVLQCTQFVIEAFPRSASTYALVAFENAQPMKLKIAHHLHVPAQVIKAVQLGIPTLVLIRSPRQAVASLLVYRLGLSAGQALRAYTSFYKTILPYKDGYVVATFVTVTGRLHNVIAAVNARFDTEFSIPVLTDRDVQVVFAQLDQSNEHMNRGLANRGGRPSSERHLRMAISEYVEHYHAERNHQGLENALIAPASTVGELSGPVLRRERLGGMLNYYHRKAA